LPFVQCRAALPSGYAATHWSLSGLIPVRFSNFQAQAYTGVYQK